MVGNPQMEDIQKLTADNFTKQTGIKVNFTILPENELRDKVTQDIATGAGQYDVVTIGAYEVPIWAKNGWLHEVTSYTEGDANFDHADLLPAMVESLSGEDGKLYAVPFYGESSFLMYRKDVFEAKGLTMPERPTWDQVAQFAAQVDGAQPGMRGICLRGLPGWGELFAPLTTVVNTFGGTWFTNDWQAQVDGEGFRAATQFYVDLVRAHGDTWYTKDWQAQVNAPEFQAATKFYVDLVRAHGEPGAAQAGFTECLNAMSQNQVAMWYDATSAAGSLEDPSVSNVAGKIGYVYAPVKETKTSGWLWAWAWAMPQERRQRREVHAVGVEQGLRDAGRPAARVGQGAGRQAHLDLPDPGVQAGRRGVRGHHPEGDPGGRPHQPGCAAAADRRHPVRRDPGVRRRRDEGLSGRQRRDSGRRGRRARPAERSAARADRGRQVQVPEVTVAVPR